MAAKAGGGSVYFGFWGIGSGSLGGFRWVVQRKRLPAAIGGAFWGIGDFWIVVYMTNTSPVVCALWIGFGNRRIVWGIGYGLGG
jgi:hypothetical protein